MGCSAVRLHSIKCQLCRLSEVSNNSDLRVKNSVVGPAYRCRRCSRSGTGKRAKGGEIRPTLGLLCHLLRQTKKTSQRRALDGVFCRHGVSLVLSRAPYARVHLFARAERRTEAMLLLRRAVNAPVRDAAVKQKGRKSNPTVARCMGEGVSTRCCVCEA